jgi:hypothetical protein
VLLVVKAQHQMMEVVVIQSVNAFKPLQKMAVVAVANQKTMKFHFNH